MAAHHYTLCGLDNLWLENRCVIKKARHGQAVSVVDVDGLHKLLANKLMVSTEGAIDLWGLNDMVSRAQHPVAA